MDAIALLKPHTKFAIRPANTEPSTIVDAVYNGYRICWYGRPGPTFVDLPGDLIINQCASSRNPPRALIKAPPKPTAHPDLIAQASQLLRSANCPLVILGKGAAHARAEDPIRTLIQTSNLPFLPTPMGKGIVPDSSPLNTSPARSTALAGADVILLLGARLNWILHYGAPPKFRRDVKIIQVDISPEELGRTNGLGEPALSILGDISAVVTQLSASLQGWTAFPSSNMSTAPANSYLSKIAAAAAKNEAKANLMSTLPTPPGSHLTYQRAFHIIKTVLHTLSPPSSGSIVYVSEGANTMDISRSSFPLSHPRQRLDAGTYATMGVGMGYAIAAYAAYNYDLAPRTRGKKIVCLEGDSALGFSAMEIETMARYKMPVLIFVMNNSGVYHGDSETEAEWRRLQEESAKGDTVWDSSKGEVPKERNTERAEGKKGLRSTSLWYETRYEMLAEMVGGRGFFVRTEDELEAAAREGFLEEERVTVVNVVVEPGLGKSIGFAWQQAKEKHGESKL